MASLWEELRSDFPGLEGQCYLNAAAASLTPRPVREAVEAFYREQETGGDGHWDAWLEKREAVRRRVARFIGAEPDEIAFVPNTSTGINLIADLLARDGPVLTDELEFPTVTLPWMHRGVPRALRDRGRGRRPRSSRSVRLGAPRGDARDQPRAVLERLPPGPGRLRGHQGRPPLRGLRQPVAGRLPRRRAPEPGRRARERGPQVDVRRLRRRLRLREPRARGGAAAPRGGLDERREPLRLRQSADAHPGVQRA